MNSSSTRREFLAGLGAFSTLSFAVAPTIGQQAGDEDRYTIGLPLEQQWKFGFADSEGIGSPRVNPGTITDEVMYVKLGPTNVDTAKIVAVDRESHDRIWETTADTGVSPPAVASDRLYVTLGDSIQALTATEKPESPEWKHHTEFDDFLSPTVVNDGVCVTGYNIEDVETNQGTEYHYRTGEIARYTKDGSLLWKHRGDLMESPYRYGDSLIHLQGHQYKKDDEYFAESGYVVSRDQETGEIQWTSPDFKVLSIRLSWEQRLVLTHTRTDAIRGISADSGEPQWTVSVSAGVEDYTVGPDYLYVGTKSSVQAVDPNSGEEIWSRSDLGPYDLFYDGGLLFVGTQDGDFYALDAQTGDLVWNESLPRERGYFRLADGVLYTFANNWVGAYIGQRGIALNQLQAARDTNGFGPVTGSVANILGRERKLNRAETAIENHQYQTAQEAITAAERRQTLVNAAAVLLTGSLTYGGTRRSLMKYRRHALETTLQEVQSKYPIQSGVLTGLTPKSLTPQVEVAIESLEQSRWGPPLRSSVGRTDKYSQLNQRLNRYVSLHDELKSVSERLADQRENIDVTAWRSAFDDAFDSENDNLQTTLQRCQQALTLTEKHQQLKSSAFTDDFDLSGIEDLMERLKSPTTQSNSAAIEYCEAAFNTIETYTDATSALSAYDLSQIHKNIQSALQADTENLQPAIGSLTDIEELLTSAVEAESGRQSLDLSHSDITHEEIRQGIQSALSRVSVEEIQQVEQVITNLKSGIWKREHLFEYSPTEFEHLIADLFADQGYHTEVTQENNDGGIDVMAISGSETIAIQVKQYSPGNRVGRPTVQQTAGVREQVGATKAMIVTSSDFTTTAKEASRQYGETVELINGSELLQYLSKSNLTPPAGSTSHSHTSRRRTKQTTSSGRSHQNERTSQYNSNITACMICGEYFQTDLEQVQLPTGETIRCCPRCKQLLEQTYDIQDHSQSDAFETLGLSPDASQSEIQQAYRERVHEAHPDQGGSVEEFKQVQQAYEILTTD
ncbi:MAG: hypothetical protein BRD21_10260 [Halobacteriales archaeon SW_8_66_22]|nr:MAG: hypothetical protein BRD21_10260 [Halobacteriales archaeon SW_8_66_22]